MRFLSIFSLVLVLSLTSCSNGFKVEDEYGLSENDLQHLVKEVQFQTIKKIGTDLDVEFTGITVHEAYGIMKKQDIMVYGNIMYNYGPLQEMRAYAAHNDGKVRVMSMSMPVEAFKN